jgi:S-adenosylmethionine:tRNA ribosyltransferase-isomerase
MASAGVSPESVPSTPRTLPTLPAGLEAAEPPEARGLRRDAVRLLVSDLGRDEVEHGRFTELTRWLEPGDLIVVNGSGTMNAALDATAPDGGKFELHVSTRLPGGFWTVEVRVPGAAGASLPFRRARAGTTLRLPADGHATLLAPYPLVGSLESPSRLWMAALAVPDDVPAYLAQFGFPIRYSYVKQPWPASMYQTVFATEIGSAEMPSAGRPFTSELVTRLISAGVQIAPLVLHTGVASLEDHEPPYEEFYRVPQATADRVNATRQSGHRVVAVGTTVVRALETVADERGTVAAGRGWTDLVITPERPLRVVDALITGLHEPHATHLAILRQVMEAALGRRLGPAERADREYADRQLERAYREARDTGYLWHEFGDSHLIIGQRASANSTHSGQEGREGRDAGGSAQAPSAAAPSRPATP